MLYTKSYLQCQYESNKLLASIERVQESYDRFPEDLILSRCLVKTLSVFGRIDEGYSTPQVLKRFLERARQANTELVQKHGYTKYTKDVDIFEATRCSDYLTHQQFNRLVHPYLDEDADTNA